MPGRLYKFATDNKEMLENGQTVLVVETVVIPKGSITPVEFTESNGRKSTRYRVAKVGQADKMNQNHRVYPKVEWAHEVNRANSDLVPLGKMCGAVDHGWGGNLKDTAIVWRTLSIESDGSITGEYEIIEGHSRGKDLKALVDAGVALGFSTVGSAKAREPSDAEREQYGIPKDDEWAVVIQDFRLIKIDAVDNPSVADAWDKNNVNTPPERGTQPAGKKTLENSMKTLAELKEKFPELYTAHEAALTAAVEAAVAKAKEDFAEATTRCAADKEQLVALRASLAETVASLAKSHGVSVPFREVSAAEAATKIEKLEADIAAKAAEVKAMNEKVEAASKAKADAEATVAEANRKSLAKAAIETAVKESKFGNTIRPLAEAKLGEPTFTAEAATAFVKAKDGEYASLLAKDGVAEGDLLGVIGTTQLPEKDNSENKGFVAELAKLV